MNHATSIFKWPFGATKVVDVVDVARMDGFQVVALLEPETGETPLVVLAFDEPRVEPGDRGLITFCRGGPSGAHWDYQKGVV